MIFDSHAHYDDEAFGEDREELLKIMTKEGIGRIVNVGASLSSTKTSIELAKKYDDEKSYSFVNGVLNALAAEYAGK